MSEVADKVRTIITDRLDHDVDKYGAIHDEWHLRDDLGADSLDVIEIEMLIEAEFNIRFSEDETRGKFLISEIVAIAEAKVAAR